MSQNMSECGRRVEHHVEHPRRLPHVHEDEEHAHGDRGDRQELAEDRDLAEGLEVVQVVGEDDHHRRGGDADQERELGDVEAPRHVAAEAGDAEAERELAQVADDTQDDDGARARMSQRQYPRLPTSAFSSMCHLTRGR